MKIIKVGVVLCSILAVSSAAPRIIGGHNAPDGEYPFMVSIRDTISDMDLCGGAIISERWILTAGHCLKEFEISWNYDIGSKIITTVDVDAYVVVGTNYIENNSPGRASGKLYNISKHFVHDKFYYSENTAVYYDIGLIQLEENMEFNKKVKSIKLPERDIERFDFTAVSMGWGRNDRNKETQSNELQCLNVTVIKTRKCKVMLEKHGLEVWNSHICALSGLGGTCHGDSGSPLVAAGEIIGIASMGTRNCIPPDVFVKVFSHLDWIYKTITVNS